MLVEATGSASPTPKSSAVMPTTFLPGDMEPAPVSGEELYERAEKLAQTELDTAVLEKLKEWDENREASFTMQQALDFVRHVQATHEDLKEKPRKPVRPWSGILSCDCIIVTFIAVFLFMVPVLIAANVTQELRSDASGVMLTTSDGALAAVAPAVAHSSIGNLPLLPEGTLRRIRDCAFAYRGVFHQVRVSSLVRNADGEVHIRAADGAMLMVQTPMGNSTLSEWAKFYRPFYGTELLNLTEVAETTPSGCRFAHLTDAPARARPFK